MVAITRWTKLDARRTTLRLVLRELATEGMIRSEHGPRARALLDRIQMVLDALKG